MNHNLIYDLMEAIVRHDTEEVRRLLRQAERQHIQLSADLNLELPEIIRALYRHFPLPGKAPFAERYWQVLPDAAYEILEQLRPFYDFGEQVELWQEHFLGSSTVCDGNEQKNGKKSKTGLKKTGIAPIVYRPRKTIGGRNAGQSLLYTAGTRISTGE